MKKGKDIKIMINLKIAIENLYKILKECGFVKENEGRKKINGIKRY